MKKPNLWQRVKIWWHFSSILSDQARAYLGADYGQFHHQVKAEIRRRVKAVQNGFDQRAQAILFRAFLVDLMDQSANFDHKIFERKLKSLLVKNQ